MIQLHLIAFRMSVKSLQVLASNISPCKNNINYTLIVVCIERMKETWRNVQEGSLNPVVHMKFCPGTSRYRIFTVTFMSAYCCNLDPAINVKFHQHIVVIVIWTQHCTWSSVRTHYSTEHLQLLPCLHTAIILIWIQQCSCSTEHSHLLTCWHADFNLRYLICLSKDSCTK
jgi:hypothetical protein